jgi:phosphate transport system substrate-binding protein
MSKKKLNYFLTVFLTVTSLVSIAFSSWGKELKIGTGAAASENIFNKISYDLEKSLGIKLAVSTSGPVQALKDLDAGKIEAAVGGVEFTDWMVLMEKEGYKIPDKSLYKYWVIGKDKVKVLLNRDVTVTDLSKKQLAAIFTGKVKNWSEVGGADKPILVILGSQIPGTQSVFQKQIMDGAEYTKEAMQGTTAEDLKNRVVRNTGAVCLGALSQVDYLVNAPSVPEIGRPITLITKGAPSEAVQTLLNYINGDGQKYIVK